MQDELTQLTLMANGDSDAFGRWAASVEHGLRRSLTPFAAVVDVEAVLQEALLRVWQVVPEFRHDGRPNALARFAVTTARNYALSTLRRSKPTSEALDSLEAALELEASIAPVTPDPHLRAAIAECRKKLAKQPAIALTQRIEAAGQDDDATLAQRAGMSLNTFLQNVTRARKALAECLHRAGVDLALEQSP